MTAMPTSATDTATDIATDNPQQEPAATAEPQNGHVLLVDDEAAFQRLGGAFLRNLGHTVTLAGDGEQALAAFAKQQPELVLLDLAMPRTWTRRSGWS